MRNDCRRMWRGGWQRRRHWHLALNSGCRSLKSACYWRTRNTRGGRHGLCKRTRIRGRGERQCIRVWGLWRWRTHRHWLLSTIWRVALPLKDRKHLGPVRPCYSSFTGEELANLSSKFTFSIILVLLLVHLENRSSLLPSSVQHIFFNMQYPRTTERCLLPPPSDHSSLSSFRHATELLLFWPHLLRSDVAPNPQRCLPPNTSRHYHTHNRTFALLRLSKYSTHRSKNASSTRVVSSSLFIPLYLIPL